VQEELIVVGLEPFTVFLSIFINLLGKDDKIFEKDLRRVKLLLIINDIVSLIEDYD
jgi:hypothetical protein